MTSPIVDIEVECPDCGEQFVAWHRASVNLSLGEHWTKEELEEVKFAICPKCNGRFEKDSLIVSIDPSYNTNDI
jgi:ribosomal protein S27AE